MQGPTPPARTDRAAGDKGGSPPAQHLFGVEVALEQVRAGKTLEDAREGGCSGCIETGSFGKEAYILTGYLNLPKILELVLNNGIDPVSARGCDPGFSGILRGRCRGGF